MAKDRERTLNPAAAQRKAEKQKALKKGKAAVAAQRTERLAQRNPARLQRQIDELKALEASSGSLPARDKKTLEDLERDVARVRKARETVGERAPPPQQQRRDDRGAAGRGREGGGGPLGKRTRDGRPRDRGGEKEEDASGSSDTDESVRNIPMPRDTPPPVPRQRRGGAGEGPGSAANATPLGEGRGGGERAAHPLPTKPAPLVAQTVYESAPVVRDLRREAAGFVPSAVRRKLEAKKGSLGGRLLEEEEVQRLESEGYGRRMADGPAGEEQADCAGGGVGASATVSRERKEEEGEEEQLAGEVEKFEKEMRRARMEEVQDEGG